MHSAVVSLNVWSKPLKDLLSSFLSLIGSKLLNLCNLIVKFEQLVFDSINSLEK